MALGLAGGDKKGMMNIPFWQANLESPATPPSRVVEDGEVEVKAADTLWSTEGTVDLGVGGYIEEGRNNASS